jgi:hypothetical protein
MAVGTTCPLSTTRAGEAIIFFRAHEETFIAVTIVTCITNSEIIDYQSFPNFLFCNTALKNEQRGDFLTSTDFVTKCYKKLRKFTFVNR